MVCVANVRVVESEAVSHAVVGQLDECAQAVGDLAGVKETHLLRKEQIAILCQCALDRAVRQRGTRVGIGNLRHQADGRQGIERERLSTGGVDSRNLFDIVEHVAIQLEFSAERRQFRKYSVTRRAGHTGLSRKAGDGPAGTRKADTQSNSQPLKEQSGRPSALLSASHRYPLELRPAQSFLQRTIGAPRAVANKG